MDELFPVQQSLSPRRAWLQRHNLTLHQLATGRWEIALDEDNVCFGDTADDACVTFCIRHRLKHWNDE